MGNRLFTIPVEKSDALNKSNNLGILKNKFSGKILFRSNLYHLLTGNLLLIDTITNRWFLEEIIEYSRKRQDINLLPALKKISASNRFDESIRQRSSEIMEIIEERFIKNRNLEKTLSGKSEEESIDHARKILAGVRFPQTTEILRLLRDKSPELKKIGLFLIGKFNMTDMSQEVCGCLNIPGIEADAFTVLQTFGRDAGQELNRFYLASSGNVNTSKSILRLLGKISSKENMTFLLERLWSNSRQLKEIALTGLINCGFKAHEDEKERLIKQIYETFSLLTWIISLKLCLHKKGDIILLREMNKEYIRWKTFLFRLLSITYDNATLAGSNKDQNDKKDDITKFIPLMADIIYHDSSKAESGYIPDIVTDKKMLKKLQRYFPGEIPQYKNLLEDLLNCDYNLISIWTKVCTLRNIAEIEDEDLAESVVALLFSPEELLQEEAARLIARSGRELYRSTSERIPDPTRKKLDKIISGETCQQELIFEKVKFLASCFSGIHEDELLFLSEKMSFTKDVPAGIPSSPEGNILWCFSADNPVPDVYIHHENTERDVDTKEMKNDSSFCYALSLGTVEEFHFQYPESSFEILKYIDNSEDNS